MTRTMETVFCVCHDKPVIQDMFIKRNGKVRVLPHNEFEQLRGAEQSAGNSQWVPGVMFRYVCPVTNEITKVIHA